MSYSETLSTRSAFERYEEVRHRFPSATFPDAPIDCSGLVEIASQFDAFLLDSFGVLNVGDRPIPGAPECIAELRKMGKRLIVLTNAASYTRADAIDKYHRLGFDFTPDEVVSSRDVATARLDKLMPGAVWGAIAAPEDRFQDIAADVRHWDGSSHVDGVLFLSSAALSGQQFANLRAELQARPKPFIIANPDLVAPRETGLSKEPGFYAHILCDAVGASATFFGKPFLDAFDDALSRLPGIPNARIAMVGDTLHTDILGGRAAGLATVLVRDHGLFAGHRVQEFIKASGIVPTFSCSSI